MTDDDKHRHDFRNQLGIILGFSEVLLAEAAARDPRRDNLEHIQSAARAALDLLARLSPDEDWSKGDADQPARERATGAGDAGRIGREVEEQFRMMLDAVTDYAILTLTPTGHVATWNAGAQRLKGYREDEIIGQHFSRFYSEDDVARGRSAWALEVAATAGRVEDEGWHVRKDGSRFWANVVITALHDGAGQLRGFIKITRDITERQRAAEQIIQAEEALRQRERRLSSIYETVADVLFDVAVERDGGYRIVSVNQAFLSTTGLDYNQVVGKRVDELIPKPSLTLVVEKYGEAIREKKIVRWEETTDYPRGTLVGDVSVAPVFDADGNCTHLVGAVHDVTERKRVETELRLQSAALNAAANAIIITDRHGTIGWINPAFTMITGYSVDEALGKNPRDLVKSGVHDPAFWGRLWDTILAGRTWHGEIINRRKDGTLYPEAQTITPVTDARGEITHFIAIKRDLTEERGLEAQFRQAQKMESVAQLAGGIAHDFNNLLTVINGMSDLVLAQLSQDDPVHADVQEIHRAGERAAALTHQLLAFSRKQILQPQVLSLNTVVAEMESMLRRLIGEDIDLVVVPTPGLGSVMADAGQIEQVIANLAVNARDAMPQGGQLTIEAQNVEIDDDDARQHSGAVPPGSYVRLTVSDSGAGMDEATRARIFEPFFTTKGGKGTGLGLSTVYGIVKQSQGFIWVYSEVGQGTSFTILLPQVTEAAGTARAKATSVSSGGTETILLVEDNAGLRKLATRFLGPAGYTVLAAATGEEGLRLLERHEAPVHLLLSDVVMPGMSGRQLAERLAQTRPGMKVLYMSGYTDDTIVRHGVLDARTPFLNKPFTAATLLQKVREVLDSQA